MNPSHLLGRSIKDFHSGETSAKIVVHSPDFDPDEQLVSYYFRGFQAMPILEKKAIELSRGTILDIGAAAGSHCLELQKRAYDVTGLELSGDACEVMKHRGVRKVLNQDIFQTRENRYDTLLMLMNGIGLVQTLDGLTLFLKHIKTLLNEGGQVLFDSANLIYLFRDDQSGEALIDLNSRYFGEIEFVMEYKGIKSDSFFWLYVDFDTLCHYAEQEGFKPELIMEDENFQYLARLTL
jgi:SAM-dependent methyltransferase